MNLSAAAGGQKQFASFVSSLPVGVWLTACVVHIQREKKRKIVSIRCASMLFVVVFIFICVDDDQSRISVPSPSVKM